MRTKLFLGTVPAVVGMLLCTALAVGAGANSKPTVKKFSAALNLGQETGVLKDTKRGASGRFTATLSGTVVDGNDNVVPDVKITVQNDATSRTREATSNNSGSFTVPLLPPVRIMT